MTTATPESTSRALKDLRAALTRRRAELLESIPAQPNGVPLEACGVALGRRNARILDDLLTSLFDLLRSGQVVVEAVRPVPAATWDKVSVAGVGSYGRGAVALKSDLDVRLAGKRAEDASAVADALL